MKIINNKQEAIQELNRISTRTNVENNNEINEVVEKTQDFLHGVGYVFEELQVKETIDDDSDIIPFNR